MAMLPRIYDPGASSRLICFDPLSGTTSSSGRGGSAALTGLVFVAMSVNVEAVTANPAHRYRATGNLIGLGAVFMLSSLSRWGTGIIGPSGSKY